tara:strand:+ start:164 stop:391 length:228 start_codon:yes stop_codon:yes gene_type:complete
MSKKETFENTLKELELIVEKLESGSLGLDEMLELFEKGIKLTESCQSDLEEAENKIKTIMKTTDGFIKKDGVQNS